MATTRALSDKVWMGIASVIGLITLVTVLISSSNDTVNGRVDFNETRIVKNEGNIESNRDDINNLETLQAVNVEQHKIILEKLDILIKKVK